MKNSKLKVKIAILSTSFLIMLPMLLAVVLGKAAEAFPEQGISTIQLLLTLPTLVATVSGVLTGKAVQYIPKKTATIAALALYIVGGIIPLIMSTQFVFFLVASGVLGFGQGILLTVSSSLVADNFDGVERSSMMGKNSAAINLGGTLLALVAGVISSVNWLYVYSMFFLAIPVIILVIFCLPKDVPSGKLEGGGSGGINKIVIFYTCFFLFYYIAQYTYSANVALFIAAEGIGDSATAGIASSIYTAAAIVSGILMGKFTEVLKDKIVPTGIAVVGVGMAVIYFIPQIAVVLIGGFLVGLGSGLVLPSIFVKVTQSVPPTASAMAIATVNFGSSIGMFISPSIINILGSSASNITHQSALRSNFICAVIICIIALIIMVVYQKMTEEKDTKSSKKADLV